MMRRSSLVPHLDLGGEESEGGGSAAPVPRSDLGAIISVAAGTRGRGGEGARGSGGGGSVAEAVVVRSSTSLNTQKRAVCEAAYLLLQLTVQLSRTAPAGKDSLQEFTVSCHSGVAPAAAAKMPRAEGSGSPPTWTASRQPQLSCDALLSTKRSSSVPTEKLLGGAYDGAAA